MNVIHRIRIKSYYYYIIKIQISELRKVIVV